MLRKHQTRQPSPTSIRKALKSANAIDLKLLEAIRAKDLEIAEQTRKEIKSDGAAYLASEKQDHYSPERK